MKEKSMQSKGGEARAKALTPTRRQEIASQAASIRWGTKRATHEGILKLGDVELPCAVLEDGTRVLSERGVTKGLGGKRGGSHWRRKKSGAPGANLPVYLSANNLLPFIDNELQAALTSPIIYLGPTGARGFGVAAELLPKICDVFLRARDANALHPSQIQIALRADILMRGLAHVGIIALVDAATGYERVRDRLALEAILEKFLTDEFSKWTKTFPDEYYRELFRLKNMEYPPKSSKRPRYIGHWTNDIVYTRLAPGVLKKLRELNPISETGYRKRKHFQHLTTQVGNPALQEHLVKIIFLMRACDTWNEFKRKLDKASTKYGDTIPMNLY